MTSDATFNANVDPDPEPSEASPTSDESIRNEESINPEVVEDDPQLLDASSRSLTTDEERGGEGEDRDTSSAASIAVTRDDIGDAEAISDKDETPSGPDRSQRDWCRERSTGALAVELKRIETEVRKLLNDRDAKRKRKLAGSRRWLELEEDLLSWQYSGRMDEESIKRLQRLVIRRNYLFNRLRFLASTRPTWNS